MSQENFDQLKEKHQHYISLGLNLDLTRGKPSTEQLDLSNGLLDATPVDVAKGNNPDKIDLRNYGGVSGLNAAKNWFAELLECDLSQEQLGMFVGGNSSLSLMQFALWLAHFFGLKDSDQSWQSEALTENKTIKMLCPVPGYDRHFSLCEHIGIEMIPVRLTGNGPDMAQVESLVKNDPQIKGIWCVPRFSNPTGEVYCDETVERMAGLAKIAGPNFYVFWDNAYAVHSLQANAKVLADIFRFALAQGTQDSILQFASSSKITFAGSGISALASSSENIKGFTAQFGFTSIGPNKINQQRHVDLLPNRAAIIKHMENHANLIAPKFQCVEEMLSEALSAGEFGQWSQPEGGYFVSFDTQPGMARRVIALAAEAGVKLTPAGSTHPYKKDPEDRNIRLAPTFPALSELKQAMEVFVNCVKIATLE